MVGSIAQEEREERIGKKTDKVMEGQQRGGKQMGDIEQCDTDLLREGAHTYLVPLQ